MITAGQGGDSPQFQVVRGRAHGGPPRGSRPPHPTRAEPAPSVDDVPPAETAEAAMLDALLQTES